MVKNHFEYAVALLVVPLVRSQLRVTAQNAKQLAAIAWNAQWDCLLLSALFDTNVLWNLQSEIAVDDIGAKDTLNITNAHLGGVHHQSEYVLTDQDETWLNRHFETAKQLLAKPAFQTAVHSLASFHWHTHPRAQLALIWSGIESIFGVESELVFRVSLYTARFLAPDDQSERLKIFGNVKKLYKQRSAAVHGSDMKGCARIRNCAATTRSSLRGNEWIACCGIPCSLNDAEQSLAAADAIACLSSNLLLRSLNADLAPQPEAVVMRLEP
jgi:hypothetical protein